MIINVFQIASFKVLVSVLLTGLIGISGCITTSDVKDRWGYTCIDDYVFTATYARNGEFVVLKDASQEFRLRTLQAASGARYSDGSMDLWTQGALAYIKVDDEMVHPDCTGSQF
ncbi:MAG: lysozyme inhibitor [Gammaproteobacteria bacterium]|nr:lysozyme inhibitor [Gammaproteobacteria bacterium]MCP4090782.1 lysozyme inhibitor [Gammaproteobacteria bacterium]MCP4277209.1 lysozyme inhibitor [Gammaproteobacteria bacterium]MCP4832831.1 lysozyme inhibitor [Gammaproteobacteria bacterium]MCP4927981.1 lysozyme inhibitor [Gammaproteobacteria bacterium]